MLRLWHGELELLLSLRPRMSFSQTCLVCAIGVLMAAVQGLPWQGVPALLLKLSPSLVSIP